MLAIRDLTVQFVTRHATVHAVTNVSLDLQRGEILGVVGETGSGKSTLIRSVFRLLPNTARIVTGEIHLDGEDILAMSRRQLRRIRGTRIGFVPQNPFGSLNPTLKIRTQFRKVIRAHERRSAAEIDLRTRRLLHQVGIEDADRVLSGYAHELSGGMAQRVVIAMALSMDPDLLLADEPTTGLDVTIQRQILDLLMSLSRERQRPTVIVTHDLGVVAQLCDRVAVMYAGQILEVGPVGRVLVAPEHPYTRALLAAVPRRGRPIEYLRGTLPKLSQPPPQRCVFYDRCPMRADPRCANERPPLVEIVPGHQVAAFCAEARK